MLLIMPNFHTLLTSTFYVHMSISLTKGQALIGKVNMVTFSISPDTKPKPLQNPPAVM